MSGVCRGLNGQPEDIAPEDRDANRPEAGRRRLPAPGVWGPRRRGPGSPGTSHSFREKRLVRLGYGVYGRAIVSRLSGDPILFSQGGFIGAARQALTKLGVKWEPSEAERDYNEGRSTQIPVNPVVRVKGRFSRRLRDGKQELVLAR